MSHPYAGADTFPANITLLDDGSDAPNMTNFMTPPTGLANRTAYTFKRVRSIDWQQSILPSLSTATLGPFASLCCAGYDSLSTKWVVAGIVQGGNGGLAWGYGDQSSWIGLPQPGGTTNTGGVYRSIIRGNEPSVSSKYLYASYVADASSHARIERVDTTGPTNSFTTNPSGSSTDIVDLQLATVPGVIVAAVSASSAGHSQLYYSSNSGSTWTAQSAITFSVAVPFWVIASNPSNQIVAIPVNGFRPTYLTSPDGSTWTSQSGLSVLGAADAVTSLCWADDGTGTGCWLLTTYNGQGLVYKSYDGFTWANVVTDLPAGIILQYMAYMSDARVLLAAVDESPTRIAYSLDGGQHWRRTPTQVPSPNTVSTVPTAQKLVAGPNQALYATGIAVVISNAIGDPGGMGLK
jgi:hypothetical protein